jgi:pyruvate,water dikinase
MNDDDDHLSPGRVFSAGRSIEQGDTARCTPACDQRPLTLPLGRVGKDELGLVGGKAANLATLMRGNLPVPPGFCVTTAAFSQFLASCPRCPELVRTLSALSAEQPDRTANLSECILACLADVPIPPTVEQAVLTAWRGQGEERAYAVRSSATVEDAADHSFAGQFESCLNVRGRDALLVAIKKCWLSLYSARALAYEAQEALPMEKTAMAVLVQEMVPAEAAGVLFTVDPITGDTGRMVIEGAPGLGDRLVSGHVNPERVVLKKETLRVIEHSPTNPPGCLDEPLAQRLGKLARKVERLFGGPQDIEWAVAGGQVFILQARAVTVTRPAKSWEDRQVWTNLNTGEVFPDVATPVTWSMIQLFITPLLGSIFRLFGADVTKAPTAGLVAGRVYFNVNTGLAALRPFSYALSRVPDIARALGGGQVSEYHQTVAGIPDEDFPDLGFRWSKYILSWPRTLVDLITHCPGRGNVFMARMKARGDRLARLDFASLATPELGRIFPATMQENLREWDLLFLFTRAGALLMFAKACRDWLGDKDLTLAYRLFSALGGLPEAEAGLSLWRLATLAHADQETEATVLNERGWPEVRAKLEPAAHGRQFLAAWERFMAEHGHHCRGEIELFNARWSETPDYILGVVRSYLQSVDLCNPVENQRRLAQERLELTAQCRRRLKNPLKRLIFSRALRQVQRLAVDREVWKNQAVRHLTVLRRILLALGERLGRAGILARPDDIFFLEVTEIESVATGQAHFDARTVINQRRAEYEKNLTLEPPPVVVGRFDSTTPSAPTVDVSAKTLRGIPVFPGVVTGPARVILRTNDHEQVLPGEILVAPFTDPAWTPYFVTAAGVVMDQGGILSHGSIVAREYGLPAVTNVGSATRVIRTGDLIQVDGNRGWVTILDRGKMHDSQQ